MLFCINRRLTFLFRIVGPLIWFPQFDSTCYEVAWIVAQWYRKVLKKKFNVKNFYQQFSVESNILKCDLPRFVIGPITSRRFFVNGSRLQNRWQSHTHFPAFREMRLLRNVISCLPCWTCFFFCLSISRLAIPEDKRIPLTERDRTKARELLERPYIKLQKAWAHEVLGHKMVYLVRLRAIGCFISSYRY